jgi:hypothetical protein
MTYLVCPACNDRRAVPASTKCFVCGGPLERREHPWERRNRRLRRVGDVVGFVLAIPLLALLAFSMWQVWLWIGFGWLMLMVALALIAGAVFVVKTGWHAFARAVVKTAEANRDRRP